jgi:hypothetical protein
MDFKKPISGFHDEYKQTRDYWQNESNFQPIQPAHIAARWRPILYPVCIGLAAFGALSVLPIEVDPIGTAIALAILGALYAFVQWQDNREDAITPTPRIASEKPAHAATTRFPPAFIGETKRLVGDE